MAFNSLAESNKTVHDNRTTCYSDPNTVSKLAEVAKQFKPSLWTNIKTTMDFPESKWTDMLPIAHWEEKFMAGNVKIYPLGPKDRNIATMKFNKFRKQGRMEWS